MDQLGAELPKTMLILKANPASLATSEMFLRNRGWAVYSTSDVKEALLLLVDKKYSYVMVSVDHANKKTHLLPKLISHKFKVGVMTFAETQSANSYNLLTASDCEYKVYAPVTGPAIERCLLKYTRDQQTMRLFNGPALAGADDNNLFYPQPLKGAEFEPSSVFVQGKKAPATDFGSVHVKTKTPELFGRVITEEKSTKTSDTLIARGTERSLLGNLEIEDGFVHNKVQQTTNSGCILVQSERFSGYLVAAVGANKVIDDPLIENIKKTLFKFLRDNGENVSENDTITVKIKPVDFEPWALEYADFLRKSVHKGDEVAVAFFPRRPVNIRLEEGEHANMAKIKLKDLKGDAKVEFDLYLHLANNNRYVLYTPQGGVFYTKQLDRLKNQGVTHLHVKKEAVPAITKYNAQNYINELVDAYVEKHRDESISNNI